MPSVPRFDQYDRGETADHGREFLRAFIDERDAFNGLRAPTAHWTEKIIDWWAGTAPTRGVVVDAHPPAMDADRIVPPLRGIAPQFSNRRGETLVDLAHHRFPSYEDYSSVDYWERAYGGDVQPEMLLALETESGKLNSRLANRSMVFEDASKLIALAARVKVVVFASHSHEERAKIRTVAQHMQRCDYTKALGGAAPTWLWVDLPWSAWTDAHQPGGWVGTAGVPHVTELVVPNGTPRPRA